jgi:hypothetical protein
MLARWLRVPRGGPEVEVGVAIPIGCLGALATAIVVLVGAGVVIGAHLRAPDGAPDHVVVRVIDDGATGGPAVISTQVVPLR